MSCVITSIASLLYGFSIGSLNLITPDVKKFYKQSVLSIYDVRLNNASKLYQTELDTYNKKMIQSDSQNKQLKNLNWNLDNYFDILLSNNENAIKEISEFIEER
jgi:hypothetical protein